MSLRTRLFVSTAAVAALTGVMAAATAVSMSRAAAQRKTVERLEAESSLLASRLAESDAGAQGLADGWARRLGVRVTVVAPDGRVVADSTTGPGGAESDAPEVEDARLAGLGLAVRRAPAAGERHVLLARRVEEAGGLVVRLAQPLAKARDPGRRATGLVLTFAGLVFLVPTTLAWLVSRRLARPFEALRVAAASIAAGDLDRPLPAARAEPQAGIGRAIDRLRRQLASERHGREDRRWLFDSLIEGLQEGLLIVGADRRVLAANDALRRNLTVPVAPIGRLQAEVFRHPDVIGAIEDALTSGEEKRRRVDDRPHTGKIFDLEVAPLVEEGTRERRGAVALFYDVSRLETLESVRQKFVADVSHELRTPLTSIKAAVETLIDDEELGPEGAKRFLEIIRRHADRMQALVGDLSDLSKIETGAIALERRELELAPLARKLVEDFAGRAQERGVTLTFDVPAGLTLHADPRRLEQVLVNLIDNAIKFNREGGTVTVRGRESGGRAIVEVQDTGIGIPSAALEDIFRRFFRVDEARSRETGGTGLGLSIVKHLMQLHGGRVRVESELGRGSTFALEF